MALKILCDTSILVAGILKEHTHHSRTLPLLDHVIGKNLQGFVAAHSLAECYAALTAVPPPLSPSEAYEILKQDVISHFQVLELSQQDYQMALDRVAQKQLRSGAIYDALIWQAAVKGRVKKLVTWNLKHFERLSNGELEVASPSDLPQ